MEAVYQRGRNFWYPLRDEGTGERLAPWCEDAFVLGFDYWTCMDLHALGVEDHEWCSMCLIHDVVDGYRSLSLKGGPEDPDYPYDDWDFFVFMVSWVEDENGCWRWRRKKTKDGYPIFASNFNSGPRRDRRAHRFSYSVFVGPLDPELEMDHTCEVRDCVNPNHLDQVTHQENVRRIRNREAISA